MLDDVITLIAPSYELNEYGVRKATETRTEGVFCRYRDATRADIAAGGRSGLNPQKTFIVFQGDYEGQPILEHAGKRYAIYRTYHIPGTDDLELHAEREGGTNAAPGNA